MLISSLYFNEYTDDVIHAAIEIQEFISKFQILIIGRYTDRGFCQYCLSHRVTHTHESISYHHLSRYHDAIIYSELFSFHDLGDSLLRGKEEMVQIYGVDAFELIQLPDSIDK
ncbi:hypothetical protein H7169_00835 [Candidatus Gracilibacteria bacterium]|nr:hypothetical protein [Candidatus Gracilibacteria bacterium]